jgi:hypothetical protein
VKKILGILVGAIAAVAIVAFVAICFGVGDENALFGSYDVREVFAYQKVFFSETLLDGHLPLWNPHTFGGWPFLANPQAQVFYPTALLYLWVPLPQALIAELILHLLLAGFGTYALARNAYGISRGSSVFAALTFCLSGTVFGHVFRGHPHIIMAMAYIPLLSLAIDRGAAHLTITSRRDRRPEQSDSGAKNVSGWWRNAAARVGPWPWIASLLLALQLLTGGLQIVWLGMLFIGLSRLTHLLFRDTLNWRGWLRESVLLLGISLAGLCLAAVQLAPSLELADLSSRPAHDYEYASTASFEPRLLPTMFDPRAAPDGQLAPGGNYGYAGLLASLLAMFGFIVALRDRRFIILLPVGAFFFLFMLGRDAFLFPLLFKYLPTVDLFRAPARALTIVHLVIALLAAKGLDTIIGRLFGQSRYPVWPVPLLVSCVCLLTWLDLVGAALRKKDVLVIPEQQSLAAPEQIRHAGILQRDRSWHRYWFYPGTLRDNHAYAIDARSIGGYDVMIPARFERFVRFMTDSEHELRGLTRLNPKSFANTPAPFPFKILGVKYADYQGRIVARHDPGEQQALARGWFVAAVKPVADELGALRYMRSGEFQPFREAVFETAEIERLGITVPGGSANIETVRVTVAETHPEKLSVQVAPHPPGYLILAETFYPGWRAAIDGAKTPVLRCDSILRCLQLEGSKVPVWITMEFRPASLHWGIAVSLASLVVVILGLIYARRSLQR